MQSNFAHRCCTSPRRSVLRKAWLQTSRRRCSRSSRCGVSDPGDLHTTGPYPATRRSRAGGQCQACRAAMASADSPHPRASSWSRRRLAPARRERASPLPLLPSRESIKPIASAPRLQHDSRHATDTREGCVHLSSCVHVTLRDHPSSGRCAVSDAVLLRLEIRYRLGAAYVTAAALLSGSSGRRARAVIVVRARALARLPSSSSVLGLFTALRSDAPRGTIPLIAHAMPVSSRARG